MASPPGRRIDAVGFFIDANLEPRIAGFLREEGYPAEYSDYVLDEDADMRTIYFPTCSGKN
jgi:hypothetical protein